MSRSPPSFPRTALKKKGKNIYTPPFTARKPSPNSFSRLSICMAEIQGGNLCLVSRGFHTEVHTTTWVRRHHCCRCRLSEKNCSWNSDRFGTLIEFWLERTSWRTNLFHVLNSIVIASKSELSLTYKPVCFPWSSTCYSFHTSLLRSNLLPRLIKLS